MGINGNEGSESPLCVGGVGGRYMDVELDVLKTDRRFPRTSGRGPLEAKNGLLMVVTRMACFSSALSGTSVGRKLMRPSKGRCEGSAAGSERRALLRNREEVERGRLGRSYGSRFAVEVDARRSELRCVDDERGDAGVLCELLKRRMDGGVRCSMPSSSSMSSTAPYPPYFRHKRATLSAHSKTLTYRTAPSCSMARGLSRRRTRTVGSVVWGMGGGLWLAMIRRELARYLEDRSASSSVAEGAARRSVQTMRARWEG